MQADFNHALREESTSAGAYATGCNNNALPGVRRTMALGATDSKGAVMIVRILLLLLGVLHVVSGVFMLVAPFALVGVILTTGWLLVRGVDDTSWSALAMRASASSMRGL